VDPCFATLCENELRSIADMHRGACDDGGLDPADLSWTIVQMDVSLLAGCMPQGDWRGWLVDEIADAEGDRASDWPDIDGNDEVREPIVVTQVDGTRLIWDGWHRTAAAIVRGDATIPTILGTRGQACLAA
jgi:hypothetical protein